MQQYYIFKNFTSVLHWSTSYFTEEGGFKYKVIESPTYSMIIEDLDKNLKFY